MRTRLKWRRGKRNDGRPWIAVPLVELEREANGSPYATSLDGDYPTRVAKAMAALMATRMEAESRAEAAAREAAEARDLLARTEGERDMVRDALRAAEAAAAQARRQAERAEAAQRATMAMPWWRRLLGSQG